MYQLLLCGLTKAVDCLKFVGLEEKKKTCSPSEVGGMHCGSPRAMFTLHLMRGEVVNLGNKA